MGTGGGYGAQMHTASESACRACFVCALCGLDVLFFFFFFAGRRSQRHAAVVSGWQLPERGYGCTDTDWRRLHGRLRLAGLSQQRRQGGVLSGASDTHQHHHHHHHHHTTHYCQCAACCCTRHVKSTSDQSAGRGASARMKGRRISLHAIGVELVDSHAAHSGRLGSMRIDQTCEHAVGPVARQRQRKVGQLNFQQFLANAALKKVQRSAISLPKSAPGRASTHRRRRTQCSLASAQ